MKKVPRKLRALALALIGICALAFSPDLLAASLSVSGTVTDPTGEPLIGVSVTVKGQPTGVTTDIDGNYTITGIDDKATLLFSYVGFEPIEEAVKGRTKIDVVMREDNELLDEVVVVGYGSLSRKELSSSIVQINKDDFNQGAMNNPMEMLSGKVAGLNVSTTAAANPNSSSDLQVRGATSISAGNGPLIVIDGVAGGDIRTLAPQDIESMSVLKDAASAAIYGTRGANGVILITTRRAPAMTADAPSSPTTATPPSASPRTVPKSSRLTNGAAAAAATTTATPLTGTTSSPASTPTTPTSTSPSTAP